MNNYYNYWTDKIEFKKKIAKELYPQLKSYIGKRLTDTTLDEVKEKTKDWMKKLTDVIFDCEIKIDVERKDLPDGSGSVEIVKAINITPIDV